MKLGFIGTGNMANAMIGGIINAHLMAPGDIVVSGHTKDRSDAMRSKYGVAVAVSNSAAAEMADVLVLAVKPNKYEKIIKEIKDHVDEHTIVVSIAPGKSITWLEEQFVKKVKLVRCMPNTPALVAEGCTGVCKNKLITDDEFQTVLKLLNGFGKAYAVDEKQMDAVVCVSGSSPAFVFMLIDAMADAAVLEGLPRKLAIELAAQAVYGSAKMVLETGKHPAELKDMVCSPSGTTIEAVAELENGGFRGTVIEAMRVCADKSRNM